MLTLNYGSNFWINSENMWGIDNSTQFNWVKTSDRSTGSILMLILVCLAVIIWYFAILSEIYLNICRVDLNFVVHYISYWQILIQKVQHDTSKVIYKVTCFGSSSLPMSRLYMLFNLCRCTVSLSIRSFSFFFLIEGFSYIWVGAVDLVLF